MRYGEVRSGEVRSGFYGEVWRYHRRDGSDEVGCGKVRCGTVWCGVVRFNHRRDGFGRIRYGVVG